MFEKVHLFTINAYLLYFSYGVYPFILLLPYPSEVNGLTSNKGKNKDKFCFCCFELRMNDRFHPS